MKWVDYREKLGIGFDDNQKFTMLLAIVKNYVGNIVGDNFDEDNYLEYCQMVGEDYWECDDPYSNLQESFDKCRTLKELVAKYIAFYNTYSNEYVGYVYEPVTKGQVLEYLKKSLDKLNIKYEILKMRMESFYFR